MDAIMTVSHSAAGTHFSVWEALDARAGALHRNLAQAVQQAVALERLVHDQRPSGARYVRRNERAGRAVIRSAVAYVEACLQENSARMVETFVALQQAVNAWQLIQIQREPSHEGLSHPQKPRDSTQDLPGAGAARAAAPATADAHAGDGV
jgi:hypothetical protein